MDASRNTLIVTPIGDREILGTRRFNAPRELVFEAHTSCEHMARWWGPARFEVAECHIDFRPGGAWQIVQRGPDGEEHTFRGAYREIVPPERIVWTFEWMGMPGHIAVETITLEEEGGVTTLTVRSVAGTPEDRDGALASGMEAGWAETWDRLEDYVTTLTGRSE